MGVHRRLTATGTRRFVVTWREGGRKRERWFDTKREAVAFDGDVKRTLRGGIRPADHRITVEQAVAVWREAHGNGLAERTRQKHDAQLNQRIVPDLGGYRCALLDVRALDAYWLRLIADGVAPVSVNQTRATLGQIFEALVRWEILERNPVAMTKRQTLPRGLADPVDFDDVMALADAAGMLAHRDHAMVLVGAFCGPRLGELLGLKWGDIRSDHIRIERAVGESLEFTPLKDYEEREVPLPDIVANALREWRTVAPPTDLVFPNTRGGVLHDGNWRKRSWRLAARGAAWARGDWSLADRNPGELRHTFASLAIDEGLPVHWIQRQMGHSKPSITLDIYGHLMERRNSTAPAAYNAALTALADARQPGNSPAPGLREARIPTDDHRSVPTNSRKMTNHDDRPEANHA